MICEIRYFITKLNKQIDVILRSPFNSNNLKKYLDVIKYENYLRHRIRTHCSTYRWLCALWYVVWMFSRVNEWVSESHPSHLYQSPRPPFYGSIMTSRWSTLRHVSHVRWTTESLTVTKPPSPAPSQIATVVSGKWIITAVGKPPPFDVGRSRRPASHVRRVAVLFYPGER